MDGVYVDTVRLRQCAMDISEEKRVCTALADQLKMAQRAALPADLPRLMRLRELAEGMTNYLRTSQETLENICELFERTGKEISDMIDDAVREIGHSL